MSGKSPESRARQVERNRERYRTDPAYRMRRINHNRFQKYLPEVETLDGLRLNVPLEQ